MNLINTFLGNVNDFIYTYILIILLVGIGLYFSVRTRLVQFRMFPEAIRVLTEKKRDGKDISSFQALMISTASRVGTGNIAGVGHRGGGQHGHRRLWRDLLDVAFGADRRGVRVH